MPCKCNAAVYSFIMRCIRALLFASVVVAGCVPSLSGQVSGVPDKSSGATGVLVAVRDGSISVKNDDGTNLFHVNSVTKIWRGRYVKLSQLHLGDDVMVWFTSASSGAIATDVVANFTRLDGRITAVRPHSIEIVGGGGAGEADGQVQVFLDDHTAYAQGSPKDLKVRRDVEVSGLDLGHKRVQASALNISPKK
jgi:hypothetical protein